MNGRENHSGKAAFEVGKGMRQVMTLSEADVEKYLDRRELLDGLEEGFRGLELGEVQSPPRTELEDMVAANIAYQRARRERGGGVMAW